MERELQIFVDAAEQLEGLKAALTEQKDSSERIRTLTDVLASIADQIGRVPTGLSSVVARAEETERKLVLSADRVGALRDAIPELVARIERSDVGRSIDVLTADIARSREDLRGFRDTSTQLQAVVDELRAATGATAGLISNELERSQAVQAKSSAAISSLRAELLGRFDQLQASVENVAKSSASAAADASVRTTDAVRDLAEKQAAALQRVASQVNKLVVDDLAALRRELATVTAQLTAQSTVLEALRKKKGITF